MCFASSQRERIFFQTLLSKISLLSSETSYDRVSLLHVFVRQSPLSLTLNKCLTLCVCGACVLRHDGSVCVWFLCCFRLRIYPEAFELDEGGVRTRVWET